MKRGPSSGSPPISATRDGASATSTGEASGENASSVPGPATRSSARTRPSITNAPPCGSDGMRTSAPAASCASAKKVGDAVSTGERAPQPSPASSRTRAPPFSISGNRSAP